MTSIQNINGSSNDLQTLKESIYPDASDKEISMVYNYCKSLKLDPLTKPVHLVPVSKRVNGQFVKQTTVMPSINLYRTIAHRSGNYAGKDEPEFGPEIEVDGIKCPEWCKVTVYRIINGQRCAFTAKEYFLENVATANYQGSKKMNQMWSTRPRGQISKCAEAQALRQAFGLDMLGLPTAEEMVGKMLFDREFGDNKTSAHKVLERLKIDGETEHQEEKIYSDYEEFIDNEQIQEIYQLFKDINASESAVSILLGKVGVETVEELSKEDAQKVIAALVKKKGELK